MKITVTGEQRARDMLETMGVEDAQSWSAGDVVELAELIRERDRLRATLDRLTDEQSGEPMEWTPTLYDGIVTAWVDDDEGESYWMARWDTKGLLRWMTGTGDTREQAVKVLVEMAPSVMMALHGWMDEETQKRHRLEQQLHRTEPEDDVVERVARWLYTRERNRANEAFANYPTVHRSYEESARKLLHDTGILTTESETP